ncbi:hypothetical protein [Mucilaginibacter gilvus]|uniref:Uncharacterized protein n=1 Tax=Mucilaginibacter gilvus TaxID=2305909 RepID=A0A3S3UP54_9SPHI|nr:hypothetical protein [Mucilaginibacter gilvus]RWY47363.1 hypothetical protein EPL05_21955 [Mucilaginibacter gilvus]
MAANKNKSSSVNSLWKDTVKRLKKIKGKSKKKAVKFFVKEKLTEIRRYIAVIKENEKTVTPTVLTNELANQIGDLRPSAHLINELQKNHILNPVDETENS